MPTDTRTLLAEYQREPRRIRRSVSRDLARRHARIGGPKPRDVPASDPQCSQHHRKLPCKRCA